MDMQNNEHFWHEDSYEERSKMYKLPKIVPDKGGKYKTNIMAFTDEHISPNTVPIYVKSLACWMKERAAVETYVMNSQTVLFPDLPLYPRSTQD
jgi:hypothetical protein